MELKDLCKSVLVVDDDESTRDLLQLLFKNEGYRVLLAESPEQAEELLFNESKAIDLAFIDVNYGAKSQQTGFDLAKKIKSQSPHLNFFIMSMDNTQENRLKSQSLGAIDFVEKNYDLLLDSFKRFQRTSFLKKLQGRHVLH